MSPLALCLGSCHDLETVILCSGQHRELCREMLDFFSVKPSIDLDIMKKSQSLKYIKDAILNKMPQILKDIAPDMVLVHGDTATARFCAQAASEAKIPIAHIEAGIRSHDIKSPYPEEEYRRYISSVAKYHFAPSERAEKNLLSEGILKKNIFTVGNTVIDALHLASNLTQSRTCKTAFLPPSPFILLTCHRRESRGEKAQRIFCAVDKLAEAYPEYSILFPIHKSEAVREDFAFSDIKKENFHVCEPLDYPAFLHAMKSCDFIISDSGGVVEEAAYLSKPVLYIRDETDRPEASELGCAILCTTHKDSIISYGKRLISDRDYYNTVSSKQYCYGDGHTSEKIVDILHRILM